MRCQTCGLDNEREAVFCVYCGIRLETQPGYTAPAATGSTIDLGRGKAAAKPAQPMPAQQQTPLPPLPVAPPPATWHQPRANNFNWLWVVLLLILLLTGFKFIFLVIPFMLFGMFGNCSHRKHWRHRHRHRW